MTEWLGSLQVRIDNLSPEYPKVPDDKIEDGEEVVGEVPESLRRLWGAIEQLRDEAIRLAEGHNEKCRGPESKGYDAAVCEEVHTQFSWLVDQADTAKDLFWTSVRHGLGIRDGRLSFRKDWKVVTMPKSESGPRISGFTIVELPLGGLSGPLDSLVERLRGRSRG